ncbi:hypothetical protein BH10CHL1_BH10CHL1_37010 [soil metagenome]
MFNQLAAGRNKFSLRISAFALAAGVLLLSSPGVSANPLCKKVKGHDQEHVATENCTSPVGLCTAGEYSGDMRGNFFGTATSLAPTADTPTTGVVLFTSDSTIHARIRGKNGDLKNGDLMIKNAGAFQTTGAGNIVDAQYITGGTAELSGATGILRASGTFSSATGMGESDYEGEICLP